MAGRSPAAAKVTSSRFHLKAGGRRKETDGADYFDYNLLAVIVLLTAFGLVMQYSVTAYDVQVSHSTAFMKQVLIAAGSVVLLIIVSRVDYHRYTRRAGLAYFLSCLLLIATRFIGTNVNGATRWIRIGPVQFQPAEVAKLTVILFCPVLIVKMGRKFRRYKGQFLVLGTGMLTLVLTRFFTDNLSTAIIIFGITYVMVIVADPHPKWYVMLLIGGIGIAFITYFVLKGTVSTGGITDFRMRRILVWLDPEGNQKDGGYQVMQGLYAIGSGGVLGKGLANSTQKLGALPEAENDMIFVIICEELGMVGAFIVIGLFIYLLYRLFFIALNAPDLLGSLITVGIFTHVALQVVVNIAVVLNVIPTTGITLPFVSYGGTSLLFLMAEMGIALNISGQITERKRT